MSERLEDLHDYKSLVLMCMLFITIKCPMLYKVLYERLILCVSVALSRPCSNSVYELFNDALYKINHLPSHMHVPPYERFLWEVLIDGYWKWGYLVTFSVINSTTLLFYRLSWSMKNWKLHLMHKIQSMKFWKWVCCNRKNRSSSIRLHNHG